MELQECASDLKHENEFTGTYHLPLFVNGMLRCVETATTLFLKLPWKEAPTTVESCVGATTE